MKTALPANRLREWLDAANLSQAQVARRLNVDAAQVSRWCNGRAALRGGQAAAVVALLRERGLVVDVPDPGPLVFLSTPMASLDGDSYEADRADAHSLYDELLKVAAPVYWPAVAIGSAQQFEAPDLATERNLIALGEAQAFVYLQLRELIHPTSCHIELGIAIARQIPVTVFAPSEDSLPYTLRSFGRISERAGFSGPYRFYAIRSAADAIRLLTIHGPELLGVAPHKHEPARALETRR